MDDNKARAADEEEFELNKLAEKYNAQLQLFEQYGIDTTALEEEYERQKTDISEKYAKQRAKASEEEAKLEKQSIKSTISNATSMASNLGNILGAISGMIDTSTEEGFEQAKKLQIAEATINMLTGIATALSGAFTTKTGPWDIVLAATQAAAIAATGIANIATIKNTTFENANPSSATANVSSSSLNATLVPPTDYSQAVQGATLEEKVGDTRVYVTEGDIRSTTRKVSVSESESRY